MTAGDGGGARPALDESRPRSIPHVLRTPLISNAVARPGGPLITAASSSRGR